MFVPQLSHYTGMGASGLCSVLVYNRLHIVPLLLHVRDELQLGTAAVEILALAVRAEVVIALKIVGQEADAALKRHELRAPGQIIKLRVGQRAGRALEVAPRVDVKEGDVEVDLREIALILRAVVRAETDRVAEIVDRIARHYRIKINYAHRLSCVFIKQDIVHFSVIMSHLKRKLACFMRVLKRIHIFFASDNEIYFILNAFGAAEIDFVIQRDGQLIPIEVKSADNTRAKSLKVYMDTYKPAYAIKLSAKNFAFEDNKKVVPLYAAFCI